MCLRIVDNSRDITEFLRAGKYGSLYGSLVFHKVLYKHPDTGVLYSPTRGHVWKGGLNVSSRESVDLTDEEVSSGTVKEGFHLYVGLPAYDGKNIRFRVKVAPGDIVAVGYDRSDKLGKMTVVATRAVL
jgi:hypothetical protein